MPAELKSFIKEKRANWERLSQILSKAEKRGLRKLSEEEIDGLGQLYRSICSDLAYAKDQIRDEKLSDYLNVLAGKAHNYIYQKEPFRLSNVIRFYRYQFPQIFRDTKNYTLFAFLFFIAFSILGYFTVMLDESFASLVIPPHIIDSIEKGEMWTTKITTVAPQASSAIMTNNITVTFIAFALGVTLGMGTLYILALNGLLLGTMSYLIQARGMVIPFWSFVLPHGIIELSAIMIAGGAGLLLGSAQLIATDLSRKESLLVKGNLAVKLILGCIPVLIVAAIVEGFFSPLPEVSPFFKFSMGILLGFSLWIYLSFSKRY
ncbi:MAG: stage II sporulation protein M [Deltaproteobacteria bacterium]|nr:stage II sporulation protein M [Deltaproteobacteria bacterium]